MQALLEFARGLAGTLGFIAAVYAGALLAERLWPAERGQPVRRMAFNVVLGVLLFTVSAILVANLQPLIAPLVTAPLGQRFHVELPDGLWGSIVQVVLFMLAYDFFYYWWHRAQHEITWLWPQHELHHSDTALNVTTSLRHHWLEDPLRVFAMAAPFGFLFYFKPSSVPWVATVAGLWPFFIHTNVRLRLGWLTPVVAGPQYHRIHHSIEARHWNRNYAAYFPIWDIVFGTAHMPAKDEWPATGVPRGEPPGIAAALVAPFIDWARMLRRARATPSSDVRGHAFGLDAIRAVAVSSVLIAHGSLFYTSGPGSPGRYPLVVFGVLGVEIFFALSGFLVGRQLLLVAEGKATAMRFLARRWVRTLPNYYLFLAINAALVLWLIDRQHPDARFLVFAQALAWPATSAFFPESWSLAVEEWFYLLAAGAFALAALCRASPRALGIGLAALLVAGPVARVIAQAMFELQVDAGVRKISLLRLDSLAFGLACAALERHAAPLFERLKGRSARIAGALLAALAMGYLARAAVELAIFEPAGDAAGRWAAALVFSALPLAAALFLPWLSAWRPASTLATRAVESLSAWSYSIYLVHFPLLLVLLDRWPVAPGDPAGGLLRTVAWLVGTLALAAFVHVAYERPLLRYRPSLIQ